jgi:hypothetical protein
MYPNGIKYLQQEEFIKRFAKTAHARATVDKRSLVQYRDVGECLLSV